MKASCTVRGPTQSFSKTSAARFFFAHLTQPAKWVGLNCGLSTCHQRWLTGFNVGLHRRLEKRYLRPVQPRAHRWWEGARERFTRGAATCHQCSIHCESSRVAHGASKWRWALQTTLDIRTPTKGVRKANTTELHFWCNDAQWWKYFPFFKVAVVLCITLREFKIFRAEKLSWPMGHDHRRPRQAPKLTVQNLWAVFVTFQRKELCFSEQENWANRWLLCGFHFGNYKFSSNFKQETCTLLWTKNAPEIEVVRTFSGHTASASLKKIFSKAFAPHGWPTAPVRWWHKYVV